MKARGNDDKTNDGKGRSKCNDLGQMAQQENSLSRPSSFVIINEKVISLKHSRLLLHLPTLHLALC